MIMGASKYFFQLRVRRCKMPCQALCAGGHQFILPAEECVSAFVGQWFCAFGLRLRFGKLGFGYQSVDQHDTRRQFVVGLLILMKLLFAFTDYSLCVGGVTLINGQTSQSSFSFCRRLFLASLFTDRQCFFVRLAGGDQITAIGKNVPDSRKDIGESTLVIPS